MSLAEEISARTKLDRKAIEIPEWGDEDNPLVLYSTSVTAGDVSKLQRSHKNFLNDLTMEAMIDLIILKAETKDGEKAFTIADKPFFRRQKVDIVATLAGNMFGETLSVEEHEKN
jgi:hypothetical protein